MDTDKIALEKTELIDELESLKHRLDCGVEMLSTIREAMEDGKSSSDTYSGALFAAADYLDGLTSALENLIERL